MESEQNISQIKSELKHMNNSAMLPEQMIIDDLQEFLEKERNAIEEKLQRKVTYECKVQDFICFYTLGAGSFGKVVLAKHKESGKYFAIKVIIKKQIVKSRQIQHTLNEKHVLESIRFPFVVHMEYFFQDNTYLYFTLPFILGGDLFNYLRKIGKLPEVLCRFYGAQIALALEYLHFLNLAYRDLKPENILIDANGYLKLTDFGFCKMVKGRTYTLCGTPEYLAPEIIMSKGYGKSVDWWSYGVLLYEMFAGYPPFFAKDHLKLYEKIVFGKYRIASHFSTDFIDILRNILQVDLSKRYGNLRNGINDIKSHSWFKAIEWHMLLNQKIEAPYFPQVRDLTDISNFELIEFTSSTHNKYAKEFEDF